MILVADCGGTKTDWRVIDGSTIHQFQTDGFNPYHQQEEHFEELLKNQVLPKMPTHTVSNIYFYGTGLTGPTTKAIISRSMIGLFPHAKIEVENDLLAAARALCGASPGIACILGTGSNSCYYDGKAISQKVSPLGYVLGDEGSGAAFGKQLVKDYLRGKMPDLIKQRFEKRFPFSQEDILSKVYKEDRPNHFLASFAKFLLQNITEPYIYSLVYAQLCIFFDEVLAQYPMIKTQKVNFVGSIAFYFGNVLRQVGNDKGISIGIIMETPIAGLALYHQQTENPAQ